MEINRDNQELYDYSTVPERKRKIKRSKKRNHSGGVLCILTGEIVFTGSHALCGWYINQQMNKKIFKIINY